MVEYYNTNKKKGFLSRHKKNILIFLIFLVLFLLIFYPALFPTNTTGGVIRDLNEKGIIINAKVNPPELNLDDSFEKISILTAQNISLGMKDQKINIPENSEIIFENFNGEISFDKSSIIKLKGKSKKISVNSMPIESNVGAKLDVFIDSKFDFDILNMENIFIPVLNYQTSGLVNLNNDRTVVNVKNESVLIENYRGDLKIQKEKLNLDGKLSKIDIAGESKITASI